VVVVLFAVYLGPDILGYLFRVAIDEWNENLPQIREGLKLLFLIFVLALVIKKGFWWLLPKRLQDYLSPPPKR